MRALHQTPVAQGIPMHEIRTRACRFASRSLLVVALASGLLVAGGARAQAVPHSLPASAVYYLMDCTLRGYDGNGMLLGERAVKAGAAVVQAPIAAHMLENAGPQPCKLIMFEPR